MKNNKIMWIAVSLIVMTTIAITISTKDSRSQEKSSFQTQTTMPTPENNGYKDMSRYAIADYDELLPTDDGMRQKRKLSNGRYDGMGWVAKKPDPDTDGSGLEDEKNPPPLLPIIESDLIAVGQISESHAHLSNDKLGVYTEFTIQVKQILKGDVAKKILPDEFVTADREGGYVRYSNGQKVFYENSNKSLPQLGNEYVFFLTSDKQSPNYNILTLYELKSNSIVRLDYVQNLDDFKDRFGNTTKSTFVELVRSKISQLSQSPK